MSKIFFHVDVNSAFLSWSAIKHLRDGEDVDLRPRKRWRRSRLRGGPRAARC